MPTVTVIVPVFNASATVDSVLKALTVQTYPSNKTELVFVDNGSSDNTIEIIRNYPVTLISEDRCTSPYAARNFGIRHSKGQIIAFTDANKIPEKRWLEEGISALMKSKADLAGGDIQFVMDKNPEVSEVYDSLTFNNNRHLVENEKGSACGNLFVKRDIFEKMGLFPRGIRSGMDIWWTQKAFSRGFALVFAEKAVVHCIPRRLPDILKKSYRVGVSHPMNMKSRGIGVPSIFREIIKTFAPPRISSLRKKLGRNRYAVSLLNLWIVAWVSRICLASGRLYGLLFMSDRPEAVPFLSAQYDTEGE